MTKFLNISKDNTLGGSSASDEVVSSQKAVKDYVDNHSSSTVWGNITGTLSNQTDLDNALSAKQDEATAVNYDNITNCITEIPQDIKLELNNGTLTLKAGSKVYIPNGFESDGTTPKFNVVTIDEDKTFTQASAVGTNFIYVNATNQNISRHNNVASGTSVPSGFAGTFYNTSTNDIHYYSNGTAQGTFFSFPIAIITIQTNQTAVVSSIDQVFNGFGYIGSTVFALPDVKGLIPNGRNADGSLKNIEFTTDSITTRTESGAATTYISLGSAARDFYRPYFEQLTQPSSNGLWYNPETNLIKRSTDNGTTWIIREEVVLGKYISSSGGKIASLEPKTAFHAVDYNDFADLQDQVDTKANDSDVVKTSTNQTIAGEKTFTNSIKRSAALSSSENVVTQLIDTNGKGIVKNTSYYTNNTIYNRLYAENNTAEKNGYIEIKVYDNGNVIATIGGSGNNQSTSGASNSTTDSNIPTKGWVNNPATSTNVVHRTGDETIAGTKTFTAKPYFQKVNPEINKDTTGKSHLWFKNTLLDKTATQTADSGAEINFIDKNDGNVALLRLQKDKNGNNSALLVAYKNSSDTAQTFGVYYNVADDKFRTIAPASDGNNSIVTTTGISKASNGYVKLGNGIIIQWGNANAGSTTTVTLPTAFTGTNYRAVCTNQSGNGYVYAPSITDLTTTDFKIHSYAGASSTKNWWIAIGY